MQLGVMGLDPHQGLGQAPGQHRVDRAEAQPPAQARATGQGVGQLVIGGQDAFGAGHGQLPGLGQYHLTPAAVEQRDLQLVFEGLDVQAHRRGRQAEQVGSAGEGAMAGDGHQGAQGFEGHAGGSERE